MIAALVMPLMSSSLSFICGDPNAGSKFVSCWQPCVAAVAAELWQFLPFHWTSSNREI